MRKVKTPSNPVEQALQNVRDFVVRSVKAGATTKAAVARAADLDEKSIRRIEAPAFNPRAKTLSNLVDMLPDGWKAGDPLPSGAGDRGASAAARGEGRP